MRDVYRRKNKFPKEERYALGNQISRPTTPITSNIAEGTGRNSLKKKIRFTEVAVGSMAESFSQLQNAQDLGYITEEDGESVNPRYNHVAAILSLLRKPD